MSDIPTEPGAYFDKGGDLWIRTRSGMWVDADGDAPTYLSPEHEAWLQKIAPFTRVPKSLTVKTVYRVINKSEGYESEEVNLFEEAKLDAVEDGDVIEKGLKIETTWEAMSDEDE